jgi:sugar-specific transcriptional regulator TrmB
MDLGRFGFTPTEAKVYVALLSVSPATGYAVAHAAKLARANVYDALESLTARGAATRLPGRPTRYAAAEPETLIERLRHELTRDLDTLGQQLRSVSPKGSAPGRVAMETLDGGPMLLERAARCASGAREELLAVAGPWARDLYRPLEVAAQRRTTTRVLSLGAPAPLGATVRPVSPPEIEQYWGGFPVAVVADRRRAVCGVLRAGGQAAGIATDHPGLVPFLRHLLRREFAATAPQRVS